MAVIQAGRPPGAPPGPRLNPNAFGGEGAAMQAVAGIVLAEADQRIEQRRASTLATARANAMVQTDALVASIADNPDFNAHQDLWRTGYAQIEANAQAAVGDDWVALAPDMIRLRGDGSSRVTAHQHNLEDDFNVASLDTLTHTVIERARVPGTDHEANLDFIRHTFTDASDTGLISRQQAVAASYAAQEAYNIERYGLQAMNDPMGLLNQQSTGAIPLTAPDGANLDRAFMPTGQVSGLLPTVTQGATYAGQLFGAPLNIISGNRTAADTVRIRDANAAAHGGVPNNEVAHDHSQHEGGGAIDISTVGMSEPDRGRLMAALIAAGYTGFGSYQTGGDGHIHADMRGTRTTWTSFSPSEQAALDGALVAPTLPGQPDGQTVAREERPTTAPSSFIPASIPQYAPLPGLSVSQSNTLFNQAEARVNEMLAATQADLTSRIADEQAALLDGVAVSDPVNVGDVAAAFPFNPAHAQEMVEGLNATRSIAGELQALPDLSNPEMTALRGVLAEELAAGGSTNYRQAAARVAVLDEAIAAQQAARLDNPAAYALQHNPQLQADHEAAFGPDGTNEMRTAVLQDMADIQRGYQTGVAPELLTDQFAASVAAQYNESTVPADRVNLLAALTTGLGNDVLGEGVMDQLVAAGVHPEMREIVDLNTRDPNRAAMYAALLPGLAESVQAFDDAQATPTDLTNAETRVLSPYQARAAVYQNRAAIVGDVGETAAMWREEQDSYMRLAKALIVQQGGDVGVTADQVYSDFYSNEAATSDDVGFAFIDQDTAPQVMAGMEAVLTDLLPTIFTRDYIAAAAGFEIPAGDRRIAIDTVAALMPDARFVNHGETETGERIFAIAMPIRNDNNTVEQPMMLSNSNGTVMTWTATELQAAAAGDFGQRGGGGLRPPPTAQPPSEPTFTPIPNAPGEQRSPPGVQQETWNSIAADAQIDRVELTRILLAYDEADREWIAARWADMDDAARQGYRDAPE